jgi:hypothetical protein
MPNTHTSPSPSPSSTTSSAARKAASAAGEAHAPTHPDPAHLWLNNSLRAAQRSASWLEQWQLYEAQATGDWLASLNAALQELERAADAQAMAAVPARLAIRQFDVAARRAGEACMQWFDAELQWLAQAREQSRLSGLPVLSGLPIKAMSPGDGRAQVAH